MGLSERLESGRRRKHSPNQLTRAGVATGLVSVPNRYMHTPAEMIHLEDLTNAAKLMAEFVLALTEQTSFHPDI